MLILHADGGCQPNPGQGTFGVVVYKSGARVHVHSEAIGHATNNVAEWRAAIYALEYILNSGDRFAELRMDSRMVVMQLNGRWKVKHPNLKVYGQMGANLLSQLQKKGVKVTVNWVGREHNGEADAAAGAAQKHHAPMWQR